jgi:drug/metabolite transporter (DMT)-like permease
VTTTQPHDDDALAARRAAASLIGSSVLFTLMALGTRAVAARIPGPQVALIRFLTGIVAVAAAVALGRARLRPTRWGWLLARGVFGGTAVFSYFTCIEKVGVGVATLLNYTAPVWSMLFGWWLLRERPTRAVLVGLGLTILGVAAVMGGQMFEVRGGLWVLTGFVSAVLSGIAVTSIRAVRRRGVHQTIESSWTVFASFTLLGALATLPGVLPPWGRWVDPTAADWGWLIAVGVFSVGAQLIMTQALEHVTAATSGIIHQLTVVMTLMAGVWLFREPLSSASIIGSVLTMAGVAWTILASGRSPAARAS